LTEVKNNWAPPTLREMPFWRDGMTPEEFDREREYYYDHYDDLKNGTYKPLWRQKGAKE